MNHCPNCKRDLPEGQECPVCKIKIPTDKQIAKLYYANVGACPCDEVSDLCHLLPGQIYDVIVEWEKIRGE